MQLRGCTIVKGCCNSKIPSRARFSRCVGGCDGAWLGNWFKLILNSMPLMSVVLLAVCECQMRVTKTVLRSSAHDDGKSIHNCSIISTNCQNTMNWILLRSQNYLFVTLTTLAAAAFRIGRCKKLSSILCDFFSEEAFCSAVPAGIVRKTFKGSSKQKYSLNFQYSRIWHLHTQPGRRLGKKKTVKNKLF